MVLTAVAAVASCFSRCGPLLKRLLALGHLLLSARALADTADPSGTQAREQGGCEQQESQRTHGSCGVEVARQFSTAFRERRGGRLALITSDRLERHVVLPIASELGPRCRVTGAQAFDDAPETGRMVHLLQVRQLVRDHVVDDVRRGLNESAS